jgi:hypothetical protein
MFRTTLTVLFAALTLSVPAFAQKGATGQDATQAKPLAELKETESTWEEVPVLNGTGSTKPQTGSEVIVVDAAPSTNDPLAYPAKPMGANVAEPLEFPMAMAEEGDLPALKLGCEQGILRADVYAASPKWFGGVLLSLQGETAKLDWLGQSILVDATVMGLGFGTDGHLSLKLPVGSDFQGIKFFGQAVVADGQSILVGEVVAAIAN